MDSLHGSHHVTFLGTEAAYALSVVLGKEHARAVVAADVTVLGLPAAQIERACHVIKQRLKLPDSQMHQVQALVAAVPGVLHMNPDNIRTRLDALACSIAHTDGVQLRNLVLANPKLLVERSNDEAIAQAAAEIAAAWKARAAAKLADISVQQL